MFQTRAQSSALVRGIRDGLKGDDVCDVALAPSFTALSTVAEAVTGTSIRLAGQNMHEKESGAFTGEISPAMLKDAGCSHVILGHSERRQLFGETDVAVMRKARAAHDFSLTPIVCVGETLGERETSRTFDVVERHLEHGLRHVTPAEASTSVIAYEPVWAIGTGKTATPEQAQEVHAFIRKLVSRSHGEAVSRAIRILYGGSVKPDNAKGLLDQPDIDGALVGGACLVPESFLAIIAAARK